MIYGLGLCAGIGGFEQAIQLAFGSAYRTVAYVERDAYAQAVLVARMEEASLERALIWDDLATFDGKSLRGKVHIVSAGVPCQAYSLAGKQEGNTDKRSWGEGDGPIPHVLRIIAECQPALVLFECVSAWVRSSDQWFRPVGEELCRMGYTLVEPVFIAASDVGASHERERVFVLAYSLSACEQAGIGSKLREQRGGKPGSSNRRGEMADASDGQLSQPRRGSRGRDGAGPAGEEMADTERGQRRPNRGAAQGRSEIGTPTPRGSSEMADPASLLNAGQQPTGSGEAGSCRGEMADALRQRRQQKPGSAHENEAEHERRSAQHDNQPSSDGAAMADTGRAGLQGHAGDGDERDQPGRQHKGQAGSIAASGPNMDFAPGPNDPRWPEIIERWPHLAPAVEPGFRCVAHEPPLVVDASRADQLRCIGNGCVPLQAATAIAILLKRAGLGHLIQ